MVLNGARIYNEGVSFENGCEEKLRQIVAAIKSLSPSSDVSMRFLKNGAVYEGLLWGKTQNMPLGVYKRGPSLGYVLDTIYRKVKKDCLKVLKGGVRHTSNSRAKINFEDDPSIALAG